LPTNEAFRHTTTVNLRDKIIAWENLPAWRAALRASGRKLVVTNGCFDILHPGHVTYLEAARNHGDALLVGVNADASVRENKGPQRPVNSEDDRVTVLAALQSVDGVCIFTERTAINFLKLAQPDVYVKGGDQNLSTVPAEELKVVEQCGGKVVFAPLVKGKSTTALLEKISKL
jgi:rfaE bifunctional protein nucleotidyltransferase chain/domain